MTTSSTYISKVSTPDSCWEASDHHGGDVEDEIVFDPWDPEGTTGSGKNIGLNKEKSAESGLSTLDASKSVLAEGGVRDFAPDETSSLESDEPQDIPTSEDKTETERASTVDGTAPMVPEDKENRNALEKATEDMLCADVEPMELADDGSLSSNQDWLDDDLPDETEDDGFEYSDSDDSAHEDSDLLFDDIPEFDEDAQQKPWEIEPEEGPSIRRARDKAADIASLLALTSRDDQEIALTYLTDLFEHPDYSHFNTFQAIKRIASDGLNFETLKAMVELRSIWRQRTDWWIGRYPRKYWWWGRYYWRFRVRFLSNGETALTWVAAHRVCLVRRDCPPEMMIDDEWLDEWLRLPPRSPGYMSFSCYIDVKMQKLDAELLDYGLSRWRQCEKRPDVFERTTATAAHSVPQIDLWRGKGKRK